MAQNVIARSELQSKKKADKRERIRKGISMNWDVYILALPGLVLLAVLRYMPMYGVMIAFKDFNIFEGIWGSEWIGFENFSRLVTSSIFKRSFINTLVLSVGNIIFGMPAPIIFALLLNEVRNATFKRSVQTITYIPHFISWVVISGIVIDLLSPTNGLINRIIELFGGEAIFFMTDLKWIRTVVIASEIWKGFGWGAIIYLAALSGIDPELYEAAAIDGAGRWRQTIHITLPSIKGTFIVLLIMRLGGLMNANFDQIYMLYNPSVYAKIDVTSTYVYRTAFDTLDFSYTTAAGLVSQVIGCVLLLTSDRFIKYLGGRGLY